MCNIITFRFTCQHTLRRRRSQCGGTKHKVTANSIKAACIAESLLTICLQIECDRCQHTAWEDAWKLKLERANMFLTKLIQHSTPGNAEVATLAKELEAEYATASWNTRTMFTHGPKPNVSRVKHSYYEKVGSKLPQEVRPEDVIEKKDKEWIEMDNLDYDGDYEASTDPIHPVSTNYSHPLDADDGAWILQHLSEVHVVNIDDGDGVDFENGHGWSWGEGTNDSNVQTAADAWQEEATQEESERAVKSSRDNDRSLTAWGPEADAPSSRDKGEVQLNDIGMKEAEHRAKVEEVIKTFWSVVNHNSPSAEQQSSAPTS